MLTRIYSLFFLFLFFLSLLFFLFSLLSSVFISLDFFSLYSLFSKSLSPPLNIDQRRSARGDQRQSGGAKIEDEAEELRSKTKRRSWDRRRNGGAEIEDEAAELRSKKFCEVRSRPWRSGTSWASGPHGWVRWRSWRWVENKRDLAWVVELSQDFDN